MTKYAERHGPANRQQGPDHHGRCRPFREHGYLGTALSDVITESGAPRGSLYFHFRGGRRALGDITATLTADRTTRIRQESK
jgi:Bacterial regulatory proteins, tetR family